VRIKLLAFGSVVFLAAGLIFFPAIWNDGIGDDVLLLRGPLDELAWSSLETFWTEPYHLGEQSTGLYRPLSTSLLGLETMLWDEQLWAFRLVNFLLHGFCSLLVWSILRSFLKEASAFVGGLIFAIHPVHYESVATVYGQIDLWAAAFALAALYLHCLTERRVGRGRDLAIGLLYLGSLLCKEAAVLLPLIFLLPLPGSNASTTPSWLNRVRLLMIPGCLLMAYLAIRWIALGGELRPTGNDAFSSGYPVWLRPNLSMVVFAEYLRLMLLPTDLTMYYGHLRGAFLQIISVPHFLWFLAAAIFIKFLERLLPAQPVHFLLLLGFIFLSPLLHLVPIGTIVAERALYLPSIALCGLFALIWNVSAKRLGRARYAILALVLFLSVWQINQTAKDWRTQLSHWQTTAENHPTNAKAQALSSVFLSLEARNAEEPLRTARLVEARKYAEIAQDLVPSFSLGHQAEALVDRLEYGRRNQAHEVALIAEQWKRMPAREVKGGAE